MSAFRDGPPTGGTPSKKAPFLLDRFLWASKENDQYNLLKTGVNLGQIHYYCSALKY